MQRTYRERKYVCGDYIEVAIYPVYTQTRGRSQRKKPTSEVQQRLNHRHATDRLRRLLHTNFNPKDLFVTLTFDEDSLPETVADCQREVQNYLRRVKRRYAKAGLEPRYIYIIEYGAEHNRLHAHLVISEGLSRDELSALWGQGTVSADRLRFEADGLTALAVYLTKGKDDEGDRLTFKRWSGSRNLAQPTITECDGRISHKKMIDFCERDSDSAIYLETHFNGFETVENSIDYCEDTYGGLYLTALLRRLPTKKDLPFLTSSDWLDF